MAQTARAFLPSPLQLVLVAGALALAGWAHAQAKPSAAPAAAATAAVPADAQKEAAGKLAAQAWLLLLDRRDWGTAWDSASTGFKQAVPLGNWMDNIPKVREPLGALKERQPGEAVYKTSLPGRPAGHYVSVAFASTFEKGELSEVVTTVLDADGRFRVLGYSPSPR